MKHYYKALLAGVLAQSVTALADQAAYDDCILEHLKGAKLDVAVHLIRQACRDNHLGAGFVSTGERAYNDCLLEHLVGVESTQAAMAIKAACGRKHK